MDRLIFISLRDISLPKGPSINERELMLDFLELSDDSALFVLPFPSGPIDKAFNDPRVHFIKWDSKYLRFRIIKHQIYIAYLLFKKKVNVNDLLYVRINSQSFGIYLVLYFLKCKLILRHFSARSVQEPSSVRAIYRLPIIKLIKNLSCIMAQKASLIETCTEEHKETVIYRCGINPDKIFVVTNGVNTSRVAQRSMNVNHDEITVGYIGGKPRERGGRYVFHLVKAMQKKGYNAHGIVIGGTEMDTEILKKDAADIGIQNNLTIKSAIPYDDVFNWMARLDIGIALNNLELLKLIGNANQKLRQYLASGVFVISDPTQKWLEEENVGLTVSPIESEVDFDLLATKIYKIFLEDNFRENCKVIAKNRFSIRKLNTDRIKLWQERLY